jgi:crotonobetaine/carnitine-CoA ligase
MSGAVSWTNPLEGIPLRDQNVPTLLERRAADFGDRPFVRLGTVEWTFEEAPRVAAAVAGRLHAAGIGPGDRVALMCGNRIELLETFLGCLWLGAVAVPLNTALRGAQLGHELANSGSRALLIERDLVEVLALVPKPPELTNVWSLDGLPSSTPAGYRIDRPPDGGTPAAFRRPEPGDPAAILYTSGTTGPSKGVTAPAAQFYWWGAMMSRGIRIREDDVLYNCLPLYHANALMAPLQSLVTGATSVLGVRFSASRFWEHAAEAGATVSYLLGGLAGRLLAQPPGPADRGHRVRAILSPGMPAPLWEPFCERFGVEEIVECYGMTETNHCIGRTADHPYSRPGTMGYLFEDFFEARVVDEDDLDMPAGVPGELVLRHRHPFSFATGYWGMPDKTVEAYRNLWFHTGDRVARDADGCFRFVDRAKDSLRRLGENISSWEVEEAILAYDSVAEVAVFPVRSAEADEEVMAAIVVRDGAPFEPAELLDFLQPRLAYFALPRYVDVVAELPHTPNGKVQKGELRARGVTAATWDRRVAGYEVKSRRSAGARETREAL